MGQNKLKLEKFKIMSMKDLHIVKGGSDPSDTDPMGPVITVSTQACISTLICEEEEGD